MNETFSFSARKKSGCLSPVARLNQKSRPSVLADGFSSWSNTFPSSLSFLSHKQNVHVSFLRLSVLISSFSKKKLCKPHQLEQRFFVQEYDRLEKHDTQVYTSRTVHEMYSKWLYRRDCPIGISWSISISVSILPVLSARDINCPDILILSFPLLHSQSSLCYYLESDFFLFVFVLIFIL